jgi:hypothetical protein
MRATTKLLAAVRKLNAQFDLFVIEGYAVRRRRGALHHTVDGRTCRDRMKWTRWNFGANLIGIGHHGFRGLRLKRQWLLGNPRQRPAA